VAVVLAGGDGLAVPLELELADDDVDGLAGPLELGAVVAEVPLEDGVAAGELALRDGAGTVVVEVPAASVSVTEAV